MQITHYEPGAFPLKRLSTLLERLDNAYIPPISSLTPIDVYAQKLHQYADLFIVTENGLDEGLCAVYMNHSPTVYITSIGLSDSAQGKGAGLALMQQTERLAHEKGFTVMELEVYESNHRAMRFYCKYGFFIDQTGPAIKMRYHILK